MKFAIDTSLSFAESWLLLNNLLSKINVDDFMQDIEEKKRVLMVEMWSEYKEATNSSLDHLMEKYKYEPESYPDFSDYANKLFTVSPTRRLQTAHCLKSKSN